MKSFKCLFWIFLFPKVMLAQLHFSQGDSLRAFLNPNRTCFDVLHYGIKLKINPAMEFISGSCKISFLYLKKAPALQLDLEKNLVIDSIFFRQNKISFSRMEGHILIPLSGDFKPEKKYDFTVFYSGKPISAENPPWSDGLVWKKDPNNKPFLGITCESSGASIWFPCKDHLSDKPDSSTVEIETRRDLTAVSNGKLWKVFSCSDSTKTWVWKNTYPIHTYNITFNIGDYTLLKDSFQSPKAKYAIQYYVLKSNAEKARQHFKQTHKMLSVYESLFGPYPFRKDGFKVVEAPFLGMEHQSCIAYGNEFKNNAFGFDFILIHESGHEYWGNAFSMQSKADLWLHESFCTYTEALFVEKTQGKNEAIQYLLSQKVKIKNLSPILGDKNVLELRWKDSDMYYKGSWVLHTLRNCLEDDDLWFKTLKVLQKKFMYKTTNTTEVIKFMSKSLNRNVAPFFNAFLKYTQVPKLLYKERDGKLLFKWDTPEAHFNYAVNISFDAGQSWQRISPKTTWTAYPTIKFKNKADILLDKSRFLFEVEKG